MTALYYTGAIEECSELIKIICKVERFGIDYPHPTTGVVNRDALIEELGDVGAPLVHRMQLTGPCRGVLVPMASWYDAVDPDAARHRLAALAPTLTPLAPIGLAPWVLTTRVLMHRAVQLGAERPPVRKFALELSIAAEGSLASGRAVVTTYLRPRVRIDGAWQVPGHDAAILRVGYVGVPAGVGLGKQTPVLVSPAGPAGR